MDNADSPNNFTTPSPSTRNKKNKSRTPGSNFRLDTSPMNYNYSPTSPQINFSPSSFNPPQQFPQQFPHQFSSQFSPQFSPQFPTSQFSPPQFSPPQNPFGANVYNPMNPPQYTPSPYQQSSFNIPQDDSDDELVAETQPEEVNKPEETTSRGRGRGKGKAKRASRAKPEGRAPPTSWTPHELEVLSEAWSNVSNDRVVGNYQTTDAFWKRCLDRFKLSIPNTQRTGDMLTSKFREVKARVGLFSAKYNQLYNNRKSGQSDNDIFQQALADYQTEAGKPFNMIQCWNVLKDCEKFKQVCVPAALSTGSSKRSRTSAETPTTDFDLNINFEDTFPTALNPERRRKSKKADSSSSSHFNPTSDVVATMTEQLSALVQNVNTTTLNLQERQRKRDMDREEKKMLKDMDFYYNKSTEGLTGSHLEFILKRKADIRAKYDIRD